MGEPITEFDPAFVNSLLQRAEALQTESAELIRDLDLLALLGRLGIAEHVGSSVSGLMVWRDIDLGARCRDLTRERAWDALRPLLTDPRVKRVDYRDETGERSPSGLPTDQRYSFVVYYEAAPERSGGSTFPCGCRTRRAPNWRIWTSCGGD